MNKQQAQNIIRETFEKPFDKGLFVGFIKNLLKSFDETKAFHVRGYVKEEFKVYFTHSHHSRFLQVADLLIFLAGRYEHNSITAISKWHEQQGVKAWENIKANVDVKIQRWP